MNQENIINGGIFRGFIGANPLSYSCFPYHKASYLPKITAFVLENESEIVKEAYMNTNIKVNNELKSAILDMIQQKHIRVSNEFVKKLIR